MNSIAAEYSRRLACADVADADESGGSKLQSPIDALAYAWLRLLEPTGWTMFRLAIRAWHRRGGPSYADRAATVEY